MTKLLTTLSILLIATASYAQGKVYTETELKVQLPFGEANSTESSKTYTVERVIDGDTIVVTTPEGKSEKVKLIGIDAPESKPNDKAMRDSERTGQDLVTIYKMGQEATEFLKSLGLEGKEVRLEFDVQEKDKHGRLLAYVFTGGAAVQGDSCEKLEGYMGVGMLPDTIFYYVDCKQYVFINATLVASGYATPTTIPPNVKYADLFKKLYEEARDQKRGLWEDELEKVQDTCNDLAKHLPQAHMAAFMTECNEYMSKMCDDKCKYLHVDGDCSDQCGNFPCDNNRCLIKPCTTNDQCPNSSACSVGGHTTTPNFCVLYDPYIN